MRGFLFALLFLPLLGSADDALLESWNSNIRSLEGRVARDPDDFIAWNFLATVICGANVGPVTWKISDERRRRRLRRSRQFPRK
jgi:hypothetical protein